MQRLILILAFLAAWLAAQSPVVRTDSTQALTNKTIDASLNTVTNVPSSALPATADTNARVGVQQAGSAVGTRRAINFASGVTCTDDSGNERVNCTASGGGSFDPMDRTWVYLIDNFVGGTTSGGSGIGELNWFLWTSGGGVWSTGSAATTGHPGPAKFMYTGTTSSNTTYLLSSGASINAPAFTAAQFTSSGQSGWMIDYDVRVDWFGVTNSGYFVGLHGQNSMTTAFNVATAQRMTVEYDTSLGDTNWMCVSRGPSGTTRVDTGVAVTTGSWYRLTMNGNATGSFNCQVNGGTATTSITTNLPTVDLYWGMWVETYSATSRNFMVDRIALKVKP